MADYYTLLGVDRYASQEALRRAYRSQIMASHPDHNPGDDCACARAREVIEAYHVLGNPHSRRQYDHVMGYGPCYLVKQATPRGSYTSQWLPRLALILIFLAAIAAIGYGGIAACNNRTMVFRPNLQPVVVQPDPASPVIMGRPVPQPHVNVARETTKLASDIMDLIALQTTEADAQPSIRLLADLPPASL